MSFQRKRNFWSGIMWQRRPAFVSDSEVRVVQVTTFRSML